MKFSGKMCFKILLKVTKNEGFTLSLEDTFFEKPQGEIKLTPSPAVLGLIALLLGGRKIELKLEKVWLAFLL